MSMGQSRKKHDPRLDDLPDPSHIVVPTPEQAAAGVAHAIPGGASPYVPPSSAAPVDTPRPVPRRKPPVPIGDGGVGIGESEPDFKRGGKLATGGGFPNSSEAAPWYARQAYRNILHPEGLVSSMGGGRTDIHNIQVPSGSYVIPADVVSGLAEGNTMAGAGVMDRVMHGNPWGVGGGGKGAHHVGIKMPHFAKGGAAKHPGGPVPIVVAGGEMIYYPDTIANKFGDLKKGHAALDAFVRKARATNVKTLKTLPGPKK